MLEFIKNINSVVNNFVWGVPAMVCIIGVGLYLSIRTGFVQIRKFGYSMRSTIGRIFEKKTASEGSITPLPGCLHRIGCHRWYRQYRRCGRRHRHRRPRCRVLDVAFRTAGYVYQIC